jgi:GNAT superfamily N-acetyltransferase
MRYFVLCEDGAPVGAASLHRARNADLPDAAEFSFFYFLPAVCRRGYGTLLLNRLKEESAKAGFLRLCCWVLKENHRAVSFYTSQGLLPDGTRQSGPSRFLWKRFVAWENYKRLHKRKPAG